MTPQILRVKRLPCQKSQEKRYKVVYFGSASGGRASLRYIIDKVNPKNTFTTSAVPEPGGVDFFPLNLGEIRGYATTLLLFRVSSPLLDERYLFGGADGIVFVANSDENSLRETRADWKTLDRALRNCGLSLESIPMVVQLDSTSSGRAVSEPKLRRKLGLGKRDLFATNSNTGAGVFDSLKSITKLLISP